MDRRGGTGGGGGRQTWHGLAAQAKKMARPSVLLEKAPDNEDPDQALLTQDMEQVQLPVHLHWNAELAAAKSMAYLMRMEYIGYCGPEKNSVYGAAVVLPQVARSAGWPTTLTGMAIRSYIYLGLNLFLQFFLLSVINEELNIMNAFAGQPHLCDYGAAISKCPDGPNCKGPAGTNYTHSRNHPFEQWSTRMFFRDAVWDLFPERRDDIAQAVDPGEWGLEDYHCRILCCFIFVLGLVDDLRQTFGLFSLVSHVPTVAEPWLKYEPPAWTTKEQAKKVHSMNELSFVKYQVAGMPLCWKIINLIFIIVPKCWVWWTFASSGFLFIMETPCIVNLFLNSMAMTFILSLDELVFGSLSGLTTKYIMNSISDLALFDDPIEETESLEHSIHRFQVEEFGPHRWKLLWLVIPKRLFLILAVLVFFICHYYYFQCHRDEDGSLVSRPVYVPKKVPYNTLSFIYDVGLDWSKQPTWPFGPPGHHHDHDEE